MTASQPLILAVWKEACRHVEISESLQNLAPLIARHVPINHLLLRQIDLQHLGIETIADIALSTKAPAASTWTSVSPAQLKLLMDWIPRKSVLSRGEDKGAADLRFLIPDDRKGDALFCPLVAESSATGILILIARPREHFSPRHRQWAAELLEPFSAALANHRRFQELARLRETAEADRHAALSRLGRRDLGEIIIGADQGLRSVMHRIELVCKSDVPVLLFGETGTGKEVVARAVHAGSPRAEAPFLRVNCGAIPPELIDSQLFGHQRGSFTGAVDTHKGWFERADRGTLFLDEIGELPPAAQVRLLRVLQDGHLERIGGQQPIHVDVRIVAATHRDIPAMIRDGGFRQDLWYRLAVFPIDLPPLRDRTEDLPALACHFAERAATRFGLSLVMPTPEDLRLLIQYPWPGNVRELASVIDRAALLGNGRRLEIAASLGIAPAQSTVSTLAAPSSMTASPPSPTTSHDSPTLPRLASLNEATRAHIESALRATHGRIAGPFGAARLLQINPHTLRAKMRKLRISRTPFSLPCADVPRR